MVKQVTKSPKKQLDLQNIHFLIPSYLTQVEGVHYKISEKGAGPSKYIFFDTIIFDSSRFGHLLFVFCVELIFYERE